MAAVAEAAAAFRHHRLALEWENTHDTYTKLPHKRKRIANYAANKSFNDIGVHSRRSRKKVLPRVIAIELMLIK